MPPMTVLFVCSGNTCRSPLAMILARSLWPDGPDFLSAGLQAVTGQPASAHALAVAGELGLGLADHGSAALDVEHLGRADWWIGMTRSHVAQLQKHRGARPGAKIGLLGLANRDLSDCPAPEGEEVADPYGGDLAAYRAATDQVLRLLRLWGPTFSGEGKGQA